MIRFCETLSTITAFGVVILCAVAAVTLMARPSPAQHMQSDSVRVFVDSKNNCRYVVGGTEEGLHIVVAGEEHCRDRIMIDGMRIAPSKRVSL